MTAISAKEVQELRKISGAGMMECKSALNESGGDLSQAFKLLREKGIAKAEKKSSRDANEGLVGVKVINSNVPMLVTSNIFFGEWTLHWGLISVTISVGVEIDKL